MTELNSYQLVEQQEELKRCITRLSYAASGVTKDLDSALKSLRELLKSECEVAQISASIERISKLLIVIDDQTQSTQVEVTDSVSDILQLLQDNRLPHQLREKLSVLQTNTHDQQAMHISRAIVDVILNYVENFEKITPNQTVQQVEHSSNKIGFFKRLFSSKAKESVVQHESNDSRSLDSLPVELRTSLKHLTDQLLAIEHYREIANRLSEKVDSLNSITELAEILELITGAFVNIASHEHEQLERFLKSLDKRIERVNGFISETSLYSQKVTDDSQSLDQSIQGRISAMKASVNDSSSVEEIKQSLTDKMDFILSSVAAFYAQQVEGQATLSKNVESLQEQLRATEDESSRLREEFAEQRMRAQTDPLTHLPNRYSYNERLTQEYNRWRRYRSPLSLVMCDIDLFKRVNDQYGHAGGDEVLKKVAEHLQAGLRESDFVARYGGEEFIILLPETPLVEATKAMNKLRQEISELSISYDEQVITTAISIGISEFENTDTPKAVFARADKALYRAKEKGRNQVCCQRAKHV